MKSSTTLIADAGSTKIDWVLTDHSEGFLHRFSTKGINPAVASVDEVGLVLAEAGKNLRLFGTISNVYYYGAGCATGEIRAKMKEQLKQSLNCGEAYVYSDLLGAARGLLGRKPGIACILGTGSNSCLYDGNTIIANTPSLGFILGDEGSGSALGKRLTADYLKRQMPEDLATRFETEYHLTTALAIQKVYKEQAPNRFLASFAPFLHKNLADNYVRNIIDEEFKRFITRNLLNYEGVTEIPVCFTGSIAYNFSEILRLSLRDCGLRAGEISMSPMTGLLKYHTDQQKINEIK